MRPWLAPLALGPLLLAGACLDVPSGPPVECHTVADCDPGEVCAEGLCYGAPPAGQYAATLSAPSTRDEVISTEIATLGLPSNGWLGDLTLESPVTISGRVEAFCPAGGSTCSTASVAAAIRFSRPARFPGGPTLRFSTDSKPDVARGAGDSFTIRVPRTHESDPPWTITIDPVGGGEQPPADGGKDPAELVPPRHLTLYASDNLEHQTYILGGADSPIINGSLKDALGQPLVGMRVVALGRWEDGGPVTEVSTVHFSADGTYAITVASEAIGPLELVAAPFGANNVAPTLHVANVQDITFERNVTQPAGLGDPVDLIVPVEGLAGNGEVTPVNGVRVIVRAELPPAFSGGPRVVFNAEATTDEQGLARVSVLHGGSLDSLYSLTMVPAASSELGLVFGVPIDVASYLDAHDGTTPDPIRLPARIAIRGTVVDSTGAPLSAVSVTARRSLRFLWSVPIQDQPFLDEIPASTTITPDSGDFLLWVDSSVADVWGHYDIFFEPPAGSSVPSWSISDIEIPRMAGSVTVSLDTVALPDSARFHGRIVDAGGHSVEGSALRVFQLVNNDQICSEVGFAPQDCAPSSLVMGSAESDENGIVRFGMARP